MRVLLLIPAFNAAQTIEELIERASRFIDKGDIVVVDDGSDDGTGEKVVNKGVKVITHKKNMGKGAALKSGLEYAMANNYDAVITIDADLQHQPELIPKFIEAGEKSDIVIGKRNITLRNTPLDRFLSNKLTSLILSSLLRKKIPDSQCGYRFIRTLPLRELKLYSNKYELESELIIRFLRHGYRVSFVDIPVIYRGERSSINRFKDTLAFAKLILKEIFSRR